MHIPSFLKGASTATLICGLSSAFFGERHLASDRTFAADAEMLRTRALQLAGSVAQQNGFQSNWIVSNTHDTPGLEDLKLDFTLPERHNFSLEPYMTAESKGEMGDIWGKGALWIDVANVVKAAENLRSECINKK